MAEIISMADWHKRTRDDLTAEIMHHDKHPMSDTETDRLLSALNKLAAEAPMADEEKIVVFWTKLVEHLAAIDDEAQRKNYVKRITTLLNQDIVETARAAFATF